MPDITMCTDRKCPRWNECYRAQATPTPGWQSYTGDFRSVSETPDCQSFWPLVEADDG